MHFSLGDGEPTCAIEMAGIVTLQVGVIKNGVELFDMRAPIVIPSPRETRYPDQVIFHGISVDPYGEQQKANATVSLSMGTDPILTSSDKLHVRRKLGYALLVQARLFARAAQHAHGRRAYRDQSESSFPPTNYIFRSLHHRFSPLQTIRKPTFL